MSDKCPTTEELQARVRRLQAQWQERQRQRGRPTPPPAPPDWSGSNPGNPYLSQRRGRYASRRG